MKGQELHGSLFGTAYGGANEPAVQSVGDVFVTVSCTLQEFYNGCFKTVSYERQQLALDGHTIKTQTQLKEIIVKPGYSNLNLLTFKGEGHQMRKYKTDLIINFAEVPSKD